MKHVRFYTYKINFCDNISPVSVTVPQWKACRMIFNSPWTPIQKTSSVTKAIWGGYIMMCHMSCSACFIYKASQCSTLHIPLPTCTWSLIYYLHVGHNYDVGPPCITAWLLYLKQWKILESIHGLVGVGKNMFLSLWLVPTGMSHVMNIALVIITVFWDIIFVMWFWRVVLSTEL
jgi:hypothetical protein